MNNEILIKKLYTARKRLEYCHKAKATAEGELVYAQGVMLDLIKEASNSTLTEHEITSAMKYGKI